MGNSQVRRASEASVVSEEFGSAQPKQLLSTAIHQRALKDWSHLCVDVEPFIARILDELESAVDKQSVLDSLAIEDLFLCHACSTGSELALAAFSREYEVELRVSANRLGIPANRYDDVRQTVWKRLFLGDEGRAPGILDYRGTGPLRHWFRVLVTRAILDVVRREKRTAVNEQSIKKQVLTQFAPGTDPELDHIRERYKDDFRSAFEKAVGLLSAEERNLLRCTYLSGMSTDEIGRAFGMHKATAARHLARARQRLLGSTRAGLKHQLGADSDELDSIIRLFDSEVSISISRLLG